MNDTVNKEDKISFINWFMSNHDVANPAGVWMLRKIIARNSGLIKRTRFTRATSGLNCLMVVATADYERLDEEDFQCTVNGEIVHYRDMHTYLLNNKEEELFVHFKYNGYDNCERLSSLIDFKTITLEEVLQDIFLEGLIAKQRLAQLEKEIDSSLLARDSQTFYLAVAEKEELLKNHPLL